MPESSSPDAAPRPPTTGVGHYENFPVASLLCPPALRPAVMAIYHFARTADDIADEGDAPASERLAELAAYRGALQASLAGTGDGPAAWAPFFTPLRAAVRRHDLPPQLLHDLLSAFEQDVRHTASGHRYADMDELLAYCRLSANPVGRLLLHLYGVHDERSLRQSDQICSALQLINFWQDISVDHARGRHYLPADSLARRGLQLGDFSPTAPRAIDTTLRCQALVRELCEDARCRMLDGAPLARRVPGRAGWELRLVVQGGLRILDKIEALQWQSWLQRPKLGKADMGVLLWRSLLGTGLGSRSSLA
ncbi:MAG: squalene synthase HpnC [Hydrogenophaga sp.]|nr:squalene synthase HpnC [Hydrogenophaga sp.]